MSHCVASALRFACSAEHMREAPVCHNHLEWSAVMAACVAFLRFCVAAYGWMLRLSFDWIHRAMGEHSLG